MSIDTRRAQVRRQKGGGFAAAGGTWLATVLSTATPFLCEEEMPGNKSVEAGPDPLVAGARLVADGAHGPALGRGAAAAAVGRGEERGEVGVEVDDAADVVVELPDEAHVAGEVAGHLGLVVVVDLVDQEAVLVQQRLHLHEAGLERVQHLGVHAGGPGTAEPGQRRLAALHPLSISSSLLLLLVVVVVVRAVNSALLWACARAESAMERSGNR
jgi:hypothetical protein|uniref:Uncharacterized protein n=1 Tax=Zea mays TaxID=4577 RepID=A0A804LLN6_MAIZE